VECLASIPILLAPLIDKRHSAGRLAQSGMRSAIAVIEHAMIDENEQRFEAAHRWKRMPLDLSTDFLALRAVCGLGRAPARAGAVERHALNAADGCLLGAQRARVDADPGNFGR
jgi:hypothetical protein